MMGLDRRTFLKLAAAVPALGAIAAFASPLLRFLKPNLEPYERKDFILNDTPHGEPVVAARLSELKEPWSYKYFVFVQKYPQYTPEGFKAANVPGVIIRLPRKVRLPWEWAGTKDKESDLIAFSRICPHLGCIFNFVPDWKEITAGYGGYMPPDFRKHALIGCPCHLSIYDPADPGEPGRVISGPAPRPPRSFVYEVKGDDIVITRVEAGGIA
ncbi:MAG: Rieske 2Fe-2S domain-containing protein [Armatimonadetes bacterium]|nr:Rieske 2Fe-2S domain-containing protein [Armatimonadota bacterium]